MSYTEDISLSEMRQLGKRKAPSQKAGKIRDFDPLDMSKVSCLILAGGQGSRLFPLTQTRCKPAIQFGGQYRLIDVPISNALGCGIDKIFVVTQFLARSLHHHIFHTYRPNPITGGFVEVLSAEQRNGKNSWYSGTADSVRQNLDYLLEVPSEYILVLSGDQLYRMDFRSMLKVAQTKDLDVLVATLAVDEKQARRMGIMKVNEDHTIVDFHEKPTSKTDLERLETSPPVLKKMGFTSSSDRPFLGSMGIYLFKRQALIELLEQDPRDDFGKHLIPTKVSSGKIGAFAHNGYWEDIGTIESFYQANLALTKNESHFKIHDEAMPIFSSPSNLPGAKIGNTLIKEAILCEGAIVEADEVTNSIIGQRAVIRRGSIIKDSYIMGNDNYTPHSCMDEQAPYEIGEECLIKKTILDRHVRLGNRVQLINKQNLSEFDSDLLYVRDGIIVVPRGTSLPDGFIF